MRQLKNKEKTYFKIMNCKQTGGVTLTVLVVTIAVLLILAGITISATFGDGGIINKSKEAKNNVNDGLNSNLTKLNELSDELNEMMNSNGGSTGGRPDGRTTNNNRHSIKIR